MSLWGKYNRPANPAGVQPDVCYPPLLLKKRSRLTAQQNRPDTSQLDAAETGEGIPQVFNETYYPFPMPSTSGSRIPAPKDGHRGRQRAHAPVAEAFTRRPASPVDRSPTRMPAIPHQENLMSGALPTPPNSGSRATTAGWTADVSCDLQQVINENSLSPNAELDIRLRSNNTTPEWCTPRPAPDHASLADLAAATRRCLHPEQAGLSRPWVARLASNNSHGELKRCLYTRRSCGGHGSHDPGSGSERRASDSRRSSQIRLILGRIDENKDTSPRIPSRHSARYSADGSLQLVSSPSSPVPSSQFAPSPAAHHHSLVYPKLPHSEERSSPSSLLQYPLDDEQAASSSGEAPSPRPPAAAQSLSNFGQAAHRPAQLQRDPTPPDGRRARVADVEYLPENEAVYKRRTLGAFQEELRVAGQSLDEQFAETSKEVAIPSQQDNEGAERPVPLPQYSWIQIAALMAVLVGLTIYSGIALSRHTTGMAYLDWSSNLNNATLQDLGGEDGRLIFHAGTPKEVDLYTVSRHPVILNKEQCEQICLSNVVPALNLTSSRLIPGMAILTPRGSGFPAIAIPSFSQSVAFLVVVCGLYTLCRALLRRGLGKLEARRRKPSSVGWLAWVADGIFAWSEVISLFLSSLFTALVVSGTITAVFHSKT
jgi:hypothetical protein